MDIKTTKNQPSLLPLTENTGPFNPTRAVYDGNDVPLSPLDGKPMSASDVASIVRLAKGDELLDALRGMGWRKAPELERVLGVDARTVRALAAAAEGRVISGQKGYHLTAEADFAAVRHAVARLRSQAAEMNRRARSTEEERGL